MTEREPPNWGTDSFSRFFKDAEYNARATAANYPDIFAFLGEIHSALQQFEEALEKDSGWNRKFCDRIPIQVRPELTNLYRFKGSSAFLIERRPYFRDPRRHTEHEFAKFVYNSLSRLAG